MVGLRIISTDYWWAGWFAVTSMWPRRTFNEDTSQVNTRAMRSPRTDDEDPADTDAEPSGTRRRVLRALGGLGVAGVLAMIVFMLQNGQTIPLPQIVLFALLSLTGLALVTQFIRAIPHSSSTTQAHAGAETRTD